ncbi:MAG: Origin recognition complex subunit 2 [Candelina submexicana]|nr:MAG: Origin recognition complex subunit 2 [Candelina submexicana]
MKRKRSDEDTGPALLTPTATRVQQASYDANGVDSPSPAADTPSKRRRGRPPGSTNKKKTVLGDIADPSSHKSPAAHSSGKILFSTPTKPGAEVSLGETNPIVRNADRSARRKSARTLIERTVAGGLSDEDELDGGDTLAQRIWIDGDVEGEELIGALDDGTETNIAAPETPSKRGPGRPKGARRKRSPTPPQDLPPHEQYFFHNRPGGVRTSNNTLNSIALLNHEEYFDSIRAYVDPHASEIEFLEELHARSFRQWYFELKEGFNLCLYGWGSKRKLVMNYVQWLHRRSMESTGKPPTIVIVNGYTPTFNTREVLNTVATSLFGQGHAQKLGSQPAEILDFICSRLSKHVVDVPLMIVIHSIDALPLRRQVTQALLARLASHESIHLLATADTPSFPLLWDSSLQEQYNFVFHDSTTFAPFSSEINVVDDVHELLGRSGRRVGGKEGVGFVLKSLPEKARDLYRILVSEQLAAMEEALVEPGETEERFGGHGGVEYRVLYQKAVEEFICSNEMNFRTLLKEFHDHQMISSKKDPLGTEILSVPFQKQELEAIVEDLVG